MLDPQGNIQFYYDLNSKITTIDIPSNYQHKTLLKQYGEFIDASNAVRACLL